MIFRFPLAQRIALMCAMLALANSTYAARAMAESYLHAHAMSHSPSAFAGTAHDDHHEADDHQPGNEHHADGEQDGGDASRAGGVGHHHADFNVDAVYVANHRVALIAQPFEVVESDCGEAAVSKLSWGIERPPRS